MRIFRNLIQALKGLGRNKANVFLMTLGVAVGIASLTVIVAIGEGTRAKVLDRIAGFGFGPESFSLYAGSGRLFFRKAQMPTNLSFQDLEDIASLPTVRHAMPRQRKRLIAVYRKNSTSTRIYGVTPVWQTIRAWPITDGKFFDARDMDRKNKAAVLGATPIKNLFPDGEDPLGKSVRIGNVFFKVVGVLEKKGLTESGYDPDNRVLIPISTSVARLTHEAHLHSIKVQAMSPEVVEETMEATRRILRRNHNLSSIAADDFRFVTPTGIMEWVTEQKQAMNRMLILISTVSLLVGGIVIMNIMLVSIRERIHEIGVRRCFGARRLDITQQFLFESVFVSMLGGIVGTVLGVVVSLILKRTDMIPVQITWEPFVLAGIFSGAVGLVFGIQPARKAANWSPEETIR